MTEKIEIAGHEIGRDHSPYVIAEMSGNHNGDIECALRLIDAAKEAGADAVKLQTYTADTITIDHGSDDFLIKGGLWHGRRLHELYREAHTPWEWHPDLFAHAKNVGITCFSSPFDYTAVDFLKKLGAPAYKIASFELIDTPLIGYAAKIGKPLIISTGLANEIEIDEAVTAARESGAGGIALLHCVSAYPAPAADANLARIATLAARYDCPIGLSDHTMGIEVAVGAVALGACIIEKHFTLRRADGGPDAAFSLEPVELKALVRGVRNVHEAIGSADPGRAESEKGNMIFRRSLYAVQDIPAGGALTPVNVRSIRPGYGLAPKYLPQVLGKRARQAIRRGTPLSFDLIE
jgi:N-acetylneuraminate synthase